MSSRVLVTGAAGCLGAWVIRHLLEDGLEPVAFDLAPVSARLQAIVGEPLLQEVRFERGDITDEAAVATAISRHDVRHVIHLAALQIPACRTDPALGMSVNAVGTLNVFEAALANGIRHVAWASSIAVFGTAGDYPAGPVPADAARLPRTVYGVTKVAAEDAAKVYWNDHGLSSVALRPWVVYGPGRDQGLTSEPTLAMIAAAQGMDAHISFQGRMQLQFASDVARQFIDAAITKVDGARAFNLGGPVTDMDELAALIMELRPGVRVSVGEDTLPFPEEFDDGPLRETFGSVYATPLKDGVDFTLSVFTP